MDKALQILLYTLELQQFEIKAGWQHWKPYSPHIPYFPHSIAKSGILNNANPSSVPHEAVDRAERSDSTPHVKLSIGDVSILPWQWFMMHLIGVRSTLLPIFLDNCHILPYNWIWLTISHSFTWFIHIVSAWRVQFHEVFLLVSLSILRSTKSGHGYFWV